jgi:hypothetical protein
VERGRAAGRARARVGSDRGSDGCSVGRRRSGVQRRGHHVRISLRVLSGAVARQDGDAAHGVGVMRAGRRAAPLCRERRPRRPPGAPTSVGRLGQSPARPRPPTLCALARGRSRRAGAPRSGPAQCTDTAGTMVRLPSWAVAASGRPAGVPPHPLHQPCPRTRPATRPRPATTRPSTSRAGGGGRGWRWRRRWWCWSS